MRRIAHAQALTHPRPAQELKMQCIIIDREVRMQCIIITGLKAKLFCAPNN